MVLIGHDHTSYTYVPFYETCLFTEMDEEMIEYRDKVSELNTKETIVFPPPRNLPLPLLF